MKHPTSSRISHSSTLMILCIDRTLLENHKKTKEVECMNMKYSFGFLIGSFIQAGIVMLAENLGISHLGAKLTAMQLITHIFAGQIAGYILLFIMKKVKTFQHLSIVVAGAIWGIIIWFIVLPLNAARGKVTLPWEAGIGTVLSSLLAFIVFGSIATFTIKQYGFDNKEASHLHKPKQ